MTDAVDIERQEKRVSSKKQKRLESKKRKAVAYLDLVRSDSKETDCEPTKALNKASEDNSGDNMTAVVGNPSYSITSIGSDEKVQDEDAIKEAQRLVRERKKKALLKPVVYLTLKEMVPYAPPDEEIPPEIIPPLYVMDLQHLLLNGIQGNAASYKPRWCKLQRVMKTAAVAVIIIDGVGGSDYLNNTDCFPYLQTFQNQCEMVCPLQYNKTFHTELHAVPLSISQLKKVNVKVPEHLRKSVAAKLTQNSSENSGKEQNTKSISRKCLLLSTKQMMSEGYPLPVVTQQGNFQGFVFTKDKYDKVKETSPLLALDCEMCLTTAQKNELTRVSIVTEKGELVYDTLVKPYRRITNYLTKYSGITKAMLEPVTTRIEDVQKAIREILPADAILCGQSLNMDLMALQMFHPYVVDTSIIFNMSGIRGIKAGLRKLTQFFLGRVIQNSPDGHCSHEDASAALDLVKLKLSKGLEFGDATLNGIYFPDVKTYFLGDETKKKENDEADPAAADAPLPSETCNNEENKKKEESLRLEQTKQAAVDCAGDGGDSSETTSDVEEEDGGDKEPPGKKRKQEDNSKTQSEFFNSTSALLEEQTQFLFSQENSVHVNQSFFRLVSEAGRPGCVIDRESVTSSFLKEPIDIITVENDSAARKLAKTVIKSKEFLWVKFQEMVDIERDKSRRNKCMRKLDNRVRSVLKHARDSTLAVVVMTGHKDKNQLQNMRTFVKIT